MKNERMTRRAVKLLFVLFAAGAAANGWAEEAKEAQAAGTNAPGAPDLNNLPGVIFDSSIGDWVVDRFAGNSKTGPLFYQGPAREVGGLGRAKETVETPDGTVYIVCGGAGIGETVAELAKVTPDGALRLVMETDGLIEGPIEQCQAGRPIWNPKEKALYLTGPNCLRRVVEKPDGSRWVEVVAGIPGKAPGKKAKQQDGPAKEATFQSFYRGVVCNSRGTFFWLESIPYSGRLRRIENGMVSTVPLKRPDSTSNYFLNFAMGGTYNGLLSLGENDDTLYISDYYGQSGYVVLKCDVKTGLLTRFCGMSRKAAKACSPSWRKLVKPYRGETDGPALTHVGGNSGMIGHYDPFHRAIWVGCPDAQRFRWLRLDNDGWVRTVLGVMRPGTKRQAYDDNGPGIPGEQFRFHNCRIAGFDAKGGVFVGHSGNGTGIWRAYNKKEAKR